MEATRDDKFVVSAVNGNLLKKGLIGLLALIVLAGLFLLVVKPRYFFTYNGKEIVLCEGRLGWLDGHPVGGFNPMPLQAEEAKEITGQKFTSVEEAREALLKFAEAGIKKRRAELKELEQKLAGQYRALLNEYVIAREMGAKGLEKKIDALTSWLEAFGHPAAETGKKAEEKNKEKE